MIVDGRNNRDQSTLFTCKQFSNRVKRLGFFSPSSDFISSPPALLLPLHSARIFKVSSR